VVNAGYAFAVERGRQDGATSLPRKVLSGPAATGPATQPGQPDAPVVPRLDLRVQWEGGKLSLDAEGVPLSEVMRALSEASGIRVTGAESLSNPVSAYFVKVDLIPALKELLAHVSYAIAVGPDDSTSAHGTRVVILDVPAISEPPSVATDDTTAPVEPEVNLQEDSKAAKEPEAKPEEEPKAPPQDTELAELRAAVTDRDWERVRKYLQHGDPTIQAAAFEAMAAHDKARALDDLRATINDTSQASRLQALALLVERAEADEQTTIAVLRNALQDPDPAFKAYAVQMLAGDESVDATAALRETLRGSDSATKSMILKSVVHTEAGLPLLREALKDSDKKVSDMAATLLKQAEAVAGRTGRQRR
jgi:hypothetical protein